MRAFSQGHELAFPRVLISMLLWFDLYGDQYDASSQPGRCDRAEQERRLDSGRERPRKPGRDLGFSHNEKMFVALGGHAESVEEIEQIRPAFEGAFASRGGGSGQCLRQ
jgi:hypothetical protein